MTRPLLFFMLLIPLLAVVAMPVFAAPGTPAQKTSAKQAYIMDFETGLPLFVKNENEKMPTSSMSKAMTLYMVFDALDKGRISLEDKFTISEKAWRKGGSKMFVEVGKKATVEDLIRGVSVQSGNDATIVLAEGLAGDEAMFAQSMTLKAAELGMKNSNFMNASGWPDPDHYSTAKDLTMLGKHIVADFPDYYSYFSETEFTYSNITQKNRNPLLYRNIGADGIKTGHTEDGGYGLIGSGEFEGRRVVMVLNGLESEKDRAQESARLLAWALKAFKNTTLFREGETVEYAPVVMGKKEQVPLVTDHDVTITYPVTVRNDLSVKAVFDGPLAAPVAKGDRVGTLYIDIPRVKAVEVPLYAGEDVAPLGFVAATFAKAKLRLGHGT